MQDLTQNTHIRHLAMTAAALAVCLGVLLLETAGIPLWEYLVGVTDFRQVPLVIAGLSIGSFVMGLEWNGILNLKRVKGQSLATVERMHPYLPKREQLVLTALLTMTCGMLASPVAVKTYAFSADLIGDIIVTDDGGEEFHAAPAGSGGALSGTGSTATGAALTATGSTATGSVLTGTGSTATGAIMTGTGAAATGSVVSGSGATATGATATGATATGGSVPSVQPSQAEAFSSSESSAFDWSSSSITTVPGTLVLEAKQETVLAADMPQFTLVDVELPVSADALDDAGRLKPAVAMEEIVKAAITMEADIEEGITAALVDTAKEEIAQVVTDDSVGTTILTADDEGRITRQDVLEAQVAQALEDNADLAQEVAERVSEDSAVSAAVSALAQDVQVREMLISSIAQAAVDPALSTQEAIVTTLNEVKPDLTDTALTAVAQAVAQDDAAIQTIAQTTVEERTAVLPQVAQEPVLSVKLVGRDGTVIQPKYHFIPGSVVLVLEPLPRFTPGLYTLEVTVTNPLTGEAQTFTQDFAWGVLALNADQDRYRVGDTALLHMGVLDDRGEMVCEADLTLSATAPDGSVVTLTTADGGIVTSDTCDTKDSTLTAPDFSTVLSLTQSGTYAITLTAETQNGVRSTTTSIQVRQDWPYVIRRTAATRLFPIGPSPMDLQVTFAQDFRGTITDFYPEGFEIIDTDPNARVLTTATGAYVSWTGSWSAGAAVTFHVTYDAPDESPQFFLVGPAMMDASDGDDVVELRTWQIANDAPGDISGRVYSNTGATIGLASVDVKASINGDTPSAAVTTDANGSFTVSGLSFTGGSVITLFIDGSASHKAVTVSHGSGGAMTGMTLIRDTLVIQSGTGSSTSLGSPVSSSELAMADNSGDTDISAIYTMSSNNATVVTSKRLEIRQGGVLNLGGTLTIGSSGTSSRLHLSHLSGSLIQNANTITVNGPYTQSGGTFLGGTSNISSTYFSVRGGMFRSTSNTLTVTNDLTIQPGARFAHNSGTLTLNYSLTSNTLNLTGATFHHLNLYGNDGFAVTSTFSGSFSVLGDMRVEQLGIGSGVRTWASTSAITVTLLGNYLQIGSNGGYAAAFGNVNDTLLMTGSGKSFVIQGSRSRFGAKVRMIGDGEQKFGVSENSSLVAVFQPSLEIQKSSGQVTLSGSTAVRNLNIYAGNTLDVSPDGGTTVNNLAVYGSMTNTGTLTLRSNTTKIAAGAAGYVQPGGAVFHHLTLEGSQFVNTTTSFLGDVTVNGNLWVYNLSGHNPTRTWSAPSARTMRVGGNVNVDRIAGNIVFGTNMTVVLNGTGAQIFETAGASAPTHSHSLLIAKPSGTVTLSGALSVNTSGQDLTLTGGTLDLNGYNLTVNDQFTVGTGTTLRLTGDETITGGPDFIHRGSFLWYDAAGSTRRLKTFTKNYQNLILGSTGSAVFQVPAAGLSMSGSLTLSGGTLSFPGGETLTLSGSWTRTNGTFSAGTGTVVMLTPGVSNALSETTAFNHLTMDDGLVGYWKFDEGVGSSGSTIRDSSRYGHTSTLYGPLQWSGANLWSSRSYNPKYLKFNGSNTNVKITNANALNITGPITMAAWVKTGADQGVIIAGYNPASPYSGYGFSIGNAGVSNYGKIAYWSSAHGSWVGSANTSIKNNVWRHVAVAVNGTAVRFYVDGVLDANATSAQPGSYTGTRWIGSTNNVLSTVWNGSIDDVRIYNRALSASEIARLAAGHPNAGSGTLTLSSALTVNGNLTLNGSTLSPGSNNISVKGNFQNAGHFEKGTSTVNFSGTSNQTVSGSTVFHNVSKTIAAAHTLFLDHTSRQSVSGALTLRGLTANLLSIRSTRSGSGARLLLDGDSGTQTLDYLDVKDSIATGGATLTCSLGCTDSGNTFNWSFTASTRSIAGRATTSTGVILSGVTVTAAFNGGAKAGSGTTNAGGYFTISGIPTASFSGSTVVTLYIDGSATHKAVTVSHGSGSSMTGMTLIKDTLVIQSGTGGTSLGLPVTTANVVTARASGSSDTDITNIISSASASATTVTSTKRVEIRQGGVVNLGGTLTAGFLHLSHLSGALVQNTHKITLSADWTQSGGTFYGGSNSVRLSASTADLFIDGGRIVSTSSGLVLNGDFILGGGSFEHNSGNVVLEGSTTQTVSVGSTIFNDVRLDKSSNLAVTGTLDVDGTLYLDALNALTTGTIEAAGHVYTRAAAGAQSTGILRLNGAGSQTLSAYGSTGKVPPIVIAKPSGTLTIQDTIRVVHSTTQAWEYISGTVNASTANILFNGTTSTIEDPVSRFNGIEFDASTATYTVSGSLNTRNLAFTALSSLTGGEVRVSGNLSTDDTGIGSTAVIILNGTGAQIIDTRSTGDYPNGTFTIAKSSGTVTLSGALSVSNAGQDLIMTGGTLDLNSYNLTVSDQFTLGTGTTLRLTGDETITGGPDFIHRNASVWYDAAGSTRRLKTFTKNYQNLVIGSTGSAIFQLPAVGFSMSGSLTLSGGTLAAPGGETFTLSGSWTKTNGSFSAGTGTVRLAGSNQAISGSNTFYHLTKSVSTATTLTFGAGSTQTVQGTLTLNGVVGNLLSLRSSTPTSQWSINPQGTRTISYVDVQDSNNTNGTAISCDASCTNSTNNTNWTFANDGYSISGRVFSNTGATAGLGSVTVAASLNGQAVAYSTTADSNGYFSIPAVSTSALSGGTVVTLFIDGSASHKAVTVSHGSGGSMTGMTLIKNSLVIQSGTGGSQLGSPVTLPNLLTATSLADADIDSILTTSTPPGSGIFATVTMGKRMEIRQGGVLSLINSPDDGKLYVGVSGGNSAGLHLSHLSGALVQGATPIELYGPFTQSGGTFSGGSATVDVNGDFRIEAGNFLSTSNTLSLGQSTSHDVFVMEGGTFTHRSGTVQFGSLSSGTATVDVPTSVTFNNLTVAEGNTQTLAIAAGDTLIVEGTFSWTNGRINGGTIDARGTVSTSAGTDGYASTPNTLLIAGSGTQSCTIAGRVGTVTINNASATCNAVTTPIITGVLTLQTGTYNGGTVTNQIDGGVILNGGTFNASTGLTWAGGFTHTAGTFNHNNGQFELTGNSHNVDVPVSETFYTLGFNLFSGQTSTIASGDRLIALNSLNFKDGAVGGSTLEARGNVSYSNGGSDVFDGGSAALLLSGTGNQIVESEGGNLLTGLHTIAKPSGTVTLSGALTLNTSGQDLTLTGGTLDLNGYNLTVNDQFTVGTGTTLRLTGGETITGGPDFIHRGSFIWYDAAGSTRRLKTFSKNYQNLVLGSTGSAIFQIPSSGLSMSGNLVLSGGTLSFPGGETLTLSGSWTRTNGTLSAGTGTVVMLTPGASRTLSETTAFNNLTVDDGLVGYWKMDEGVGSSGSTIRDSSRYGHTTALYSNPVWSGSSLWSSRFYNQKSLKFDGSDDHVNAGQVLEFERNKKMTLSVWFNTNNGSSDFQALIEKMTGDSAARGYSLLIRGDGASNASFRRAIYFILRSNSSANNQLSMLTNPSAWSANQWNHVVVTYNGSSSPSGVRMYLNGSEVTLNTGTDNLTATTISGAPFRIGLRGGLTSGFSGSMDDVRVYDRVLSASEIARLAQGHPNAGSGTLTLGSALTVNGTLTLNGSTLSPGSNNLSLKGNFQNAGHFEKGSSTVNFSGTSNQTVSGSTVFHNFAKTIASAHTLFFDYTSKQSVSGALTLRGLNANLLSIRSTRTGSGARLLLDGDSGTQTLDYLDVKDSIATGGDALDCWVGCTDSGNTFNWTFASPTSISGRVYSNTGATLPLTGVTVAASINGAAVVSTDTVDAGGEFVLTNVGTLTGGTVVTLFIDGSSSYKAVTVSHGSGSSMTGMTLIRDTLVIQSGTGGAQLGTPVTTASLAIAKLSGSSDADITSILATATSSSTVTANGKRVEIRQGGVLSLSATMTVGTSANARLHLSHLSGALLQNNQKLLVYGHLTMSGGSFYGGTNTTLINGNITVANGRFSATSSGTSIVGSFTQTGSSIFRHNSGTVLFDQVSGNAYTVTLSPAYSFYSVKLAAANGRLDINPSAPTVPMNIHGRLTANGTTWAQMCGHINAFSGVTINSQFNPRTDCTGGNPLLTLTGSYTHTVTLPDRNTFNIGMHIVLDNPNVTVQGPNASYTYILRGLTLKQGTFQGRAGNVVIHQNPLTIQGGTFIAPSGELELYSQGSSANFTHTAGTFLHNNGTLKFTSQYQHTTITTASRLRFNHVTEDMGTYTVTYSGQGAIIEGTHYMKAGVVSGTANVESRGDVIFGTSLNGGTATIRITGTGTQSIEREGGTLPTGTFLIAKPAGAAMLSGALVVNTSGQDFTLTGGTLDLNGNNLTVNDQFTVGTGTTLRLTGDETISGGPDHIHRGTFIWYDASAGTRRLKSFTKNYQNLILGSTGSAVFQVPSSGLSMSGNLVLSGGTLSFPGGETLTLSGSWTRTNGALSAGTGTVVMLTPGGARTLSETTAFYNLTLDDGLVGHWKLDEGVGGSGSALRDNSRYGHTGTMNSNPVWSGSSLWNSKFYNQNALKFDGTDDQVVFSGPQNLLAGTQKATISAWVYRASTSDTVAVGFRNNTNRFNFLWWSDGRVYWQVENANGNTPFSGLGGTGWHHLALTFDGSLAQNSRQKGYIDGVQFSLGGVTIPSSLASAANLGNFYIGRETGTRFSRGSIDDVRLYNRALSASEITRLAQGHPNAGSGTLTLGSALTVNGTLTLNGSTLSPGSNNLSLKGNFQNAGHFEKGSSTVNFSGTSNQTVSGSTVFHNLAKTIASAHTLYLDHTSKQSVSGALTLRGLTANLLSIRSTRSGSGARLLLDGDSGTQTLDYLDVKDSIATGGDALDCWVGCTDSGNTFNWTFASPVSISGRVYANTGATLPLTGVTVAVSVNGATASSTDTVDAGGEFVLTNVGTLTGGTVVTLFIDGSSSYKAVTVSHGSGSSMTGMTLIRDTLVIQSGTGSSTSMGRPVTSSDLAIADNSGDTDISALYTMSSNNLTVVTGKRLEIRQGGVFNLGGTLTSSYVHLASQSGSLIQGSNAVTINAQYTQSGGTFSGSSGGTAFSMSGFVLSGGSFTATSGNGTFLSNFTVRGGNFVHNGGTVIFDHSNRPSTIRANGTAFNHVQLSMLSTANTTISIAESFSVAGNLTFANQSFGSVAGIWNATSAITIPVSGNLNITPANNNNYTYTNNKITFVMNGASKEFNNQSPNGIFGSVLTVTGSGLFTIKSNAPTTTGSTIIDRPGETVVLGGATQLHSVLIETGSTLDVSPDSGTTVYNLTVHKDFINYGTFNARNSTFILDPQRNIYSTVDGNATYRMGGAVLNNLTMISGQYAIFSSTFIDNIDVRGNLHMYYAAFGNTARSWLPASAVTMRVRGNVHLDRPTSTNFTLGNTNLTLKLEGTGSQIFEMAGSSPATIGAHVVIAKPSGTVTLSGALSVNTSGQDLTLTGGTLDLNGYNLTVNDQFTVGTGTTLRLTGDETITGGPDHIHRGSFLWYDAAGATRRLKTFTKNYQNIILGSTGSAVFQVPSAGLTMSGNLILSGGTLSFPGGETLTLSGSWTRTSGTFSAGTGTVVMKTPGAARSLSETTAFHSLTLDDGLVGYWKLDEGVGGSGATVKDVSVAANHGALYGAPTWSGSNLWSGQMYNAHALQFNSAALGGQLITANARDLRGQHTISAWIRPVSLTGIQLLVDSQTSAATASDQYNLYLNGANLQSFMGGTCTTSVGLTQNVWSHVAATYNGSQMYLWINGVQRAGPCSLSRGGSVTAKVRIGGRNATTYLFGGSLDDVRLYSRALSVSEVARLAQGHPNAGSGTLTLGSALTVNGTLTLNGSTLSPGSNNLSLKGNFQNSGHFEKGSSTVNFSGTSNQTISGSTVFHNFAKTIASAHTLFFDHTSKQSVSGALTLRGLQGSLLSLRSTRTGSGARLLLDGDSGTQTLDYLDVKDSIATGGQTLECTLGCVDSGNTFNWLFQARVGTVTGAAFNDVNGNGVKNGAETTGIAGLTVSVTGTSSTGASVSRSTTTSSTGSFILADVPVSNAAGYTITLNSGVTPTGYIRTRFNSSGSNILGTGSTLTVNFGYVLPSTATGSVFVDANDNGRKDVGETSGISGVTVTVLGTTGTGGSVNRSVATSSTGSYIFTWLAPSTGAYTFGVNTGTVPDGYQPTGFTNTGVTIAQGDSRITANFGYMWYRTMTGVVFLDANRNGVHNGSETTGYSGATVTLSGYTLSGASIIRSATTTSTGAFAFADVPASSGSYSIALTVPSGYEATTGSGFTKALQIGQQPSSTSFGLFQLTGYGTIRAFVWDDVNGDGLVDGSESGLSGIAVSLTGTTNTGAALSLGASTSATGSAVFFAPVDDGSGYTLTINGGAALAGRLRTTFTSTGGLTVAANSVRTLSGGFVQVSSLTGAVFLDLDEDGVRDASEIGVLSGVGLRLRGTTATGGTVDITRQSNASGAYVYGGLSTSSGTYTLTVTAPTDYVGTIGLSRTVTIATGGQLLVRDIGLVYRPATEDEDDDDDDQGEETQVGGGRRSPVIIRLVPAEPATPATPGTPTTPGTPAEPATPAQPTVTTPADITQELERRIREDRLMGTYPVQGFQAPERTSTEQEVAAVQNRLLNGLLNGTRTLAQPIVDLPARIGEIAQRTGTLATDAARRIAAAVGAGAQSAGRIASMSVDLYQDGVAILGDALRGGVTSSVAWAGRTIVSPTAQTLAAIQSAGQRTASSVYDRAVAFRFGSIVLGSLAKADDAVESGAFRTVRGMIMNTARTGVMVANRVSLPVVRTAASVPVRVAGVVGEAGDTMGQTFQDATSGVRSVASGIGQDVLWTYGQVARGARDGMVALWTGASSAAGRTTNAIADAGYNVMSGSARVVAVAYVTIRDDLSGITAGTRTTINRLANALTPPTVPLPDELHGSPMQTERLYATSLYVKEDKVVLSSLHLSVLNSITGDPYRNTPVVLFSDPKISVTNEEGVATFHEVEAGKHRLEVHAEGKEVETRDIIIEPPSGLSLEEQERIDVVMPVVKVLVEGQETAQWRMPVIGWIGIGLLLLSNVGLMLFVLKRSDLDHARHIWTPPKLG